MHDTQVLIRRAQEITTITSKRNKTRFLKSTDAQAPLLSPLSIQYQRDFRLLSPLLTSGYRLRQEQESDWAWFITLCRQRLSNSRSYISFKTTEVEELKRFMSIAKELLPLKRWLMSSNEAVLVKTKSSADYLDIKQQSNDSINTIHIGIASRDHREQNQTWQYSPLLRFFVHMMLITDERLAITDN